VIYMDEIAGYFPPVANPPSKAPLLTLLKQGRAFGIGVVLATQNPVDLDYKALANIGTWFLGRLQTERDKARVLDGLEGASAGAMNRPETDRLLSALDKRVFLLHNVHDEGPVVFQTRWTMSYLRGPLSRDQIRSLTPEPHILAGQETSPVQGTTSFFRKPQNADAVARAGTARQSAPPVLPPGIQQFFVPTAVASQTVNPVHYVPAVIGAARIGFGDSKLGIDEVRDVLYAVPLEQGAIAVDWAKATPLPASTADLRDTPDAAGTFDEVPSAGLQARNYATWAKDFARWIAQTEKLELMRQRDFKLTSSVGESERDFLVRVQDAARASRDAALDALRKKYGAKQSQLAERRRRAEAAVDRESAQASQQKLQTGLSVGATILGAFFGRKTMGASTLGRATTAARGVGRTMKETEDITRATENVDAIRARSSELEEEILQETRKISETAVPSIERLSLAPKRGQVSVQLVGLGWIPE